MRHNYAGDQGDYAKYALINALAGDGQQVVGINWYLTVHEEKNADGDVNIGTMMILGEGGEKEVGSGVSLIEKAAKAGNKHAVAHLSEIEKVAKDWKMSGIYKLNTV